jgi:hypothetical protein
MDSSTSEPPLRVFRGDSARTGQPTSKSATCDIALTHKGLRAVVFMHEED